MNKIVKHFLNKGPFSSEDLYAAFRNANTKKTLTNYLSRSLKDNSVKPIRRGLYYAVLPADESSKCAPDPFLIASKLAKDSIIAFHSALEVHGAAYSHSRRVYFYSKRRTRGFEFEGIDYVPVQRNALWGVMAFQRGGQTIKVTDRTRTVIDCIDAVDYAGGLEELIKSMDLLPSFDFEKAMEYLKKTNKRVLFSKTGFLLEHFKDRWSIPETFLNELQRKTEGMKTKYFCAGKGNGKLIARWNLIVPANFSSLIQAV